MLCVTYSAVLQTLEIRPLLSSGNVNEFLHSILYGIKWLISHYSLQKEPFLSQGPPLCPVYAPGPTSSGKVFVLKRNMVSRKFTWIELFLCSILLLEKQKTEKKMCPSYLKLASLCEGKYVL